MITRKTVIDEIQKLPEPYLFELYKIIKDFEKTKKEAERQPQSLMAKLRDIKINAPSDFSQTADLYNTGNAEK